MWVENSVLGFLFLHMWATCPFPTTSADSGVQPPGEHATEAATPKTTGRAMRLPPHPAPFPPGPPWYPPKIPPERFATLPKPWPRWIGRQFTRLRTTQAAAAATQEYVSPHGSRPGDSAARLHASMGVGGATQRNQPRGRKQREPARATGFERMALNSIEQLWCATEEMSCG